MKKFKFRLERVLEHRQVIKNEKKRLLRLANLKLQEDQDHLAHLETEARQSRLQAEGEMPVGQLLLAGYYLGRLKAEIEKQREVIAKSQELVNQATAAYIEAAKEAEAMVRLKNKKVAEYKDYVAKEDGKFLDELAVQKGNTLI